MKKIIALILVLLMVLSLAACGNKDDGKDTNPQDTNPQDTNPQDTTPEDTQPQNTVSNLSDEELVAKIAAIMDGKTGDMPVENVSFAGLADNGVEVSGLFGNWFNGMAIPEGAKIAVNNPLMMGQAHVVLLIQPAEGTDIAQLQKDLEANANPGWNVCTTADSVGSAVKDGLILFVMTKAELITAEEIIADFNK